MQYTSSLRRHARPIIAALALALLGFTAEAHAQDSYNTSTLQLNIPAVVIGSATYTNVTITNLSIANVANVANGTPIGSVDTYDPATQLLVIPQVVVDGGVLTYNNVTVLVPSSSAYPVSIGGATWVDTYDGPSSELRIPAVQVGTVVYNNALIHAYLSNIVGYEPGKLPKVAQDMWSNNLLTIPAVEYVGAIIPNVTLSLPGAEIGTWLVSLGAASTFIDAPVQGLCYSTSPSASATASPTNVKGQFLYDTGDLVTFWVDGTGGGCTGTTSASATSVLLGPLTPTGSQTSVLALAGGLQAADTLTALNYGTPSLIIVGGVVMNQNDVANLNQFIKQEGASQAGASIDDFFSGIQIDTVAISGASLVTPVGANPSTTTSALQNTVSSNLFATAAALPNQPTSVTVAPGGDLKFSLSVSQYTCPLCNNGLVYTRASASFSYLGPETNGHGSVTQINSPGTDVITTANVADDTESGTYQIAGDVISRTTSGTSANSLTNGDTFSFTRAFTENYVDARTLIGSGPFTITFTDGLFSGKVFAQGNYVVNALVLTPLTLSMVAGHTVTGSANGCPNNENVLSFSAVSGSGSAATVTYNQSCGGLPVTLTASSIPGVLQGEDSSGYLIDIGLFGAALAPGAQFVLIQQAEGSLGAQGNGGPQQWEFSGPMIAVN